MDFDSRVCVLGFMIPEKKCAFGFLDTLQWSLPRKSVLDFSSWSSYTHVILQSTEGDIVRIGNNIVNEEEEG